MTERERRKAEVEAAHDSAQAAQDNANELWKQYRRLVARFYADYGSYQLDYKQTNESTISEQRK
ncbi:hypothetical protein [Jiella pelagia]|uniref:Uncharacterized protein n=1 Tax=Jiella pelagia TaxID=2986949 RepID=A0ABY7BZ68_9HYPH|nr:hypothetical protein [Jiella pelagia]WAP69063.1 hypothetical protein OH818_01630 [Jiella pelagia]